MAINKANTPFGYCPSTTFLYVWHPVPDRVKLSFVIFDIWAL